MGGRSQRRRYGRALAALVVLAGGVALAPASASPPPPPPPELWVMDSDGTDQRVLAANAGFGASVSWAPDGRRVAYDVFSAEGWQVWVVSLDGGAGRPVARGRAPAWSPDGTRIAFIGDEFGDVYTIAPDGSGVTRVFDGPGDEGELAWSPDGELLAFTYRPSPTEWQLVVLDPATSVRRSWPLGGVATSPSWSPDGSAIAFGRGEDVLVLDVATGATTNVTSDHAAAYRPRWGRSGRIAYTGTDGIYVIDPTGGNRAFVASGSGPDWAPQGELVAFTRDGDVLLTEPGSAGEPNLTDTADFFETRPAWSPDGASLAYFREPVSRTPVYDRSISASLSGRRISGRVTASGHADFFCVPEMPVQLQRMSVAGWRTIDEKMTGRAGRFSWKVPDRSGFYRVKAPFGPSNYPEPVNCRAALTPPLRYRRTA